MDAVTVLTAVAIILAVVMVVLIAALIAFLRHQQQTQRQARHSVEQEKTRLQALLSKLDPARGRADAEDLLKVAREDAAQVRADVQRHRAEAEQLTRTEREELWRERQDVDRRERRLVEREDVLLGATRALEQREQALVERSAALDELEQAVAALRDESRQELVRVSGMTSEEARAQLLAQVEHEARRQAVTLSREIEAEARRFGDQQARQIIVGAIQRLAAEQTTESVVSTVTLPAEEMKGRIIGREGRNIRAFEQVTGVNVMIDDHPESVLLSCFDPVRREVARLTLAELVADGRIHPARIEEVYERSKRKIDEHCLRAAEDALADVGITDLHPGLLPTVGALHFRTSYGQNVLKHLIECAHLAGLMAAELGLDVATCRRAAFLHDIGKALTHEVEGTHAKVGAELARRYGEHPDIVHAIEAHHNEVEPRTVEALLTQAADAMSGGRPGARRESLEVYVKRLNRLEEIARSHDGVDKVFAMQAGREIRVMVSPDQVDDAEAHAIARDIAKQVEGELTYPGTIKVTVVRESRAIELAH